MSQTISGDRGVRLDGDAGLRAEPSLARALVEITKPGITRLVTITSGVGFGLSLVQREWTLERAWVPFLACLIGTALSSAGANALNQWLERDRDARMHRTANRPLPRGALTPLAAALYGAALGVLGVAVLWAVCGPVPAAISAITIVTYLLAYTPLKPVTPWSTPVGAVPGALPPLIGWSAAAGIAAEGALAGRDVVLSLTHPLALSLFAIMFVWQIPHTLAIAWMYKDDYARGGHRLLPVIDPDGRRTARAMLLWSALLLVTTLAPAVWMDAAPGAAYAVIAAMTGAAYLWLAIVVARTRQRIDARRMFFASIIHLPLLLLSLVSFSLVTALS